MSNLESATKTAASTKTDKTDISPLDNQKGIEYHKKAAEHYQLAAKHHLEAVRHQRVFH
jgi:hypothetical protein